MKKLLATAALLVTVLTGNAHADADMVGQKLTVSTGGQPFCTELENLKEFMMAALLKDDEQLGAILKEGQCTMLKKGTSIAVLEDMPTEDEDGPFHGIKVRAMNKKVSLVGFTLSIGNLVERK